MSDYIYVEEKLIDKLEKVGVTNGKVIMLYAKIQALAEERGYTTAGAPYFCRILNITDRQTRRYLSELESAGCITRFEKRNGAHTEARLIYPKLFVTEEDEYDLGQDCPERTEMTNDLGQKLSDPGQKCPKPRTEMSKTPDKNVQNLGQKCHPVIVSNSKYHNSTRGTAGAQRDASLVEVADAPDASLDMVANAPGNSANAARLRLPVAPEWPAEWIEKDIRKLDLRFDGRIPDNEMLGIIARTYRQHINNDELDYKEIFIEMVKEFTGGIYNCNKDEVKKVCAYICGVPENTFVPRVDPKPDDLSSDTDIVDSGSVSPDLIDSGLTDPSTDMVSTDITDPDSVIDPVSDSSADPGPSDITTSSDTKDSDTIVPINQYNIDISGSNPGDAA